jgi:hypothetical protein
MKKELMIGIVVGLVLGIILGFFISDTPQQISNETETFEEPSLLEEYYLQIDYSCDTDQDCVVKNVGNCCGYSPACTNKDAITNTSLVQENCINEGMASICGFPGIDSCMCEEGRCVVGPVGV